MSLNKATLTEGLNGVTVSRKTDTKIKPLGVKIDKF